MLLGEDGNRSRNNRPNASLKDYVAIVAVVSLSVLGLLAVSSNVFTAGNKNPTAISFFSTTENNIAQYKSSKSRSSSSSTTKPNIVFMLADDLGWNGIGYTDPTDAARAALQTLTPNLQSLAKSGVAFSNYYAQEVCTPSRASFLTGRYPISTGMQYGVIQPYNPWALNLGETTLAEVLKENGGYDAHIIGKWHLGHHTARYLPTARGFDTFTGYLDGDDYYYSKQSPSESAYYDFTVSNTTCYGTSANESAYSTYSTIYYRDLAVDVINSYKDSDTPFFLYLAFQAVHNPFMTDGDEGSYQSLTYPLVDDATKETIVDGDIVGIKGQLYALTLNVMDAAIGTIVDTLTANDMMDNTFLVFASDNGGCYCGGGKNSPYRGSKASLFEGGSKVDAFIYSPLLDSSVVGTTYSNLFHVTDWFPTLLDLADISYEPADGYALDGISHYDALSGSSSDAPRTTLVYNIYANVQDKYGSVDFNISSNGQFAIRDSQYKLVHTYNGSVLVDYIDPDTELTDDGVINANEDCKQSDIVSGSYEKYLFDLINDPYETINLIDSTDEDIVAAKENLYSLLTSYANSATLDTYTYTYYEFNGYGISTSGVVWNERGQTIGPFLDVSWDNVSAISAAAAARTYPDYCGAI